MMLFNPSTSLATDASIMMTMTQLHQMAMRTADAAVLAQVVGQYAALAAYRSAKAATTTTLPSAVTNPFETMMTGTTLPLRLALYSQRQSRMASTISNIMKCVQDTSNTIVNNMK